MSHDLSFSYLHEYVKETVNFLLSKIVKDNTSTLPIAGWHNFFEERIGTTGSAVPLLFLNQVDMEFPYFTEIINKLITSQLPNGAWTTVSMQNIPTIEATAWCLRALAVTGDKNTRNSIFRAEEWLLSQQNIEGGWGSTLESSPRTFLTVISVESLAKLTSPSKPEILNAKKWLIKSQRSNGSWGELPGQDGTIFHTSIVTKALLTLGVSVSDSSIAKAISFLENNWHPDSHQFLKETYYVESSGIQLRNIVDHDVDAAAISVLLNIQKPWVTERIIIATASIIDLYKQNNTLYPFGMKPAIWNIIPRAKVINDLLKQFIITENGRVISYDKMLLYSPNEVNFNNKNIIHTLLRTLTLPKFPITFLLILIIVLITSYQVYAYVKGFIEFKDIIMSVGVEITGLFIGFLVEIKIRNRNE